MNNLIFKFFFFAVLCAFTIDVNAQLSGVVKPVAVVTTAKANPVTTAMPNPKGKDKDKGKDNKKPKEEEHKNPCGVKYVRYNLDDEPVESGIVAGDYEENKKAFVGLADGGNTLLVGRIQISPPGILFGLDYQAIFSNDSSKIWYVYRQRDHKYGWVDSKNGEDVPFAIDFGTDSIGTKMFFGRIRNADGTVRLGTVLPGMAQMFYLNDHGSESTTKTGYQVLTCRSCKPDKKIPPPKPTVSAPPPETGCINNWIAYNGDDAPSINGISAGEHDCENIAYVGKGELMNYMVPGRIQTVSSAGLYYLANGKEVYKQNDSFYLADNPNYTYYWTSFNGHYPANTVFARSSGPYIIPIARASINGHMQVGNVIAKAGNFPGNDLNTVRLKNYEILVCDPWPKYQCNQVWKKYDSSSTVDSDGFSVGAFKDDIISYISRSTSKQINGCDYEIGRLQIAPNDVSGAYYLDDLTASEKFDHLNAEYFVHNPSYTYKWIASQNGDRVKNAFVLQTEGHRPFHIGMTQINDNVFVGKVRANEGLYFVDIDGKQKTTSSYSVLTCTSTEAANGIDKCDGWKWGERGEECCKK